MSAAELIERIRAQVPAQLRQLPAWLLHDADKTPICADGANRSGKLDSEEDRARLVPFEDAAQALLRVPRACGLGVALGEVPGEEIRLCGIDLDDCYRNGEMDARALEILGAAASYTEKSPSGKGLHILGIGDVGTLKVEKSADAPGLEMYSGERYFTVTGVRLNGAHLEDIGDAAALARKLLASDSSFRTTPGATDDAVLAAIKLSGLYLRPGKGKHLVRCPWEPLHSPNERGKRNTSVSEAAYFEPSADNAQQGGFKCQHAHCNARGLRELREYLGLTKSDREAPRIELLAFTAAEIMAPIPPEQFLLPGVPAEAYTLIAGALSSFKTTLLLYLLVWKATGWDILGLDEHGYGIDTGRCVLASYEDTDRRILAKLQQVIQSGHRHVCERFTRRDADEFIERAAAHIRRVPLMGKADCGIVRRSAGMIIPNAGMIERFLEEVQKFAPQGALIGLDPLRLAICGSQSDDDGADIAVHTLNAVATRIRGSGLIVCSHATKAGAQEPGNGYASAAYATSGSALFSQHARSNYLMARLKEAEVHDLFDLAQATAQEAQKQLVVRLTHGRLSHGAEQCDVYLVMRAGILERIAPRASQSAADVMRAAAGPLIGAIDRIKDSGLRVSADALGKDGLLAKAIGGRDKIRDALTLLRENGYIETTGTTTDRAIVVTEKGRASFAAPLGESGRELTRES